MQFIKPDIATICFGQAASAAAVLLAAGTRASASPCPHARILIHQPYAGAQGQVTDIEIAAKEILRHARPSSRRSWPATPASRSRRSTATPTATS